MGFGDNVIIPGGGSGGGGGGTSNTGAGFNYLDNLTFKTTTVQTAAVQADAIAMRRFTRSGAGNPIVLTSEVRVFDNVLRSMDTSVVGLGGLLEALQSDTLYRIFLFGQSDGTLGLGGVPYTSSDFRDDLPNSALVDANYEYVREVGEFYINNNDEIIGCSRRNDRVIFDSDRRVFTVSSVSTPLEYLLGDEIPEGITELDIYSAAAGNTTSDVANGIANRTDRIYVSYQTQNIGFESYLGGPLGVQADRPNQQMWDGIRAIWVKSTKNNNAVTGSQTVGVHGYTRPLA